MCTQVVHPLVVVFSYLNAYFTGRGGAARFVYAVVVVVRARTGHAAPKTRSFLLPPTLMYVFVFVAVTGDGVGGRGDDVH